ncbi:MULTISPECIES: carboxymuconolactone decarboxylase family protein [Niastella]|uniref:Carboxymuconolactone decarboxylase family protein n=1 Tax=Niastella soli TaxID=2821487 RepID=A0ABS3YP23_9BACT|nr:carboxymuconolactone decarboxylase family protein [Niastella soli]MBO9199627.1 carboxymuconolactone decarboxylase family protein [Niastella soli]
MHSFTVPGRDQVTPDNQAIFDTLQKNYGLIPNLFAVFAYSETALGDYLSFAGRKSSLSQKEKEVINLVVSQVNGCKYCLRGHTIAAKAAGFTADEIIEIRKAAITFNDRLNALGHFAKATVLQKGRPDEAVIDNFFDAGFTEANMIDALLTITAKTLTNYLHNITQVPIEWPEIPEV